MSVLDDSAVRPTRCDVNVAFASSCVVDGWRNKIDTSLGWRHRLLRACVKHFADDAGADDVIDEE